MRIDRGGIITGLMLILVGAFVLLNNLGLVPDFGANVWAMVFGAGSLLFLVVYLSSGLQNWGWLFPTSILGALAAVITLSEMGVEGEWVGSIFLWGVALPFWGAYVIERGRAWWPILPAGILTSVGFAPVLSNIADGEIAGSAFLFGMGLTFLLVYLASKREHWWPLIPAGVLTLLSLITFLAGVAPDNVIGLVFLFGVGGVFLAIFLTRREQWWAMIPAGIMLTAGTVAAVEPSLRGAGFWQERLGAGIFYTGMALTFGILWLVRGKNATGWAIFPTLGLAGLAVLSVVLGPNLEVIWPLALLGVGGWFIFRALRSQPTEQ